jgi:hypothetical protein
VIRRFAILLSLACAFLVAGPSALAAVGVGKLGDTSYEFAGKVDQAGPSFTVYGYLTFVRGLTDPQLFTVPGIDQSEATARFTVYASTTMVRRAIIKNVFVVSSTGTFTIYYNPAGGADFDDPSSFARGKAVASSDVRFQNIINVQGTEAPPGLGGWGADLPWAISTGTGGADQRSASTFSLGGKQVRFGRKGLHQRLFMTGEGVLLEPTQPRAELFLAGSAVVGR